MGWDKASDVEEVKCSCWRNCPFPSAGESASILPLEMLPPFWRNAPKGHVLSPPDQGDPFYPPWAYQQLSKNTGFPLWRQQQMPFSIFLCQVPDLQSTILKVFRVFHHKILFHLRNTLWFVRKVSAPRDHPLSYWHQEFHGREVK